MPKHSEVNHEDAIELDALQDEVRRLKSDLSTPEVYMAATEKDLANWSQEIQDISFVIKQIVNGNYRRA